MIEPPGLPSPGGAEANSQRVMPHSFFILSRLFLRVDNVLFRTHDVRIYHAFGSGEIVREVSGMEASYDEVKAVSMQNETDETPGLTVSASRSRQICHR